MLFKNNKTIRIGTVKMRLSLSPVFVYGPRWHWKRTYFAPMNMRFSAKMNQHVVIVGESGSGKSSLCKVLIDAIVRSGANVAVLDPHNEYLGIADTIGAEVYDSSYNGINLFDLDSMSEKEKASELTGLFRRAFRLGEVQGYTLYRAILYTYEIAASNGKSPNINDLIFTIKVFKKHADRRESALLDSLGRRLSVISSSAFSRSTDMGRVVSGNSVFLLSGLHTNEAQSIYMEGFLRKVYSKMLTMEKTARPRLYLVIDEAEKLGSNPIIGKLAAEGRKYGIGIIAIAQRSKSIDPDLRNNAAVFVSFYQREPEELNYISNFISGGNELNRFAEVKKAIRNLRRGYGIVLDSGEREPCIARFDIIEDDGVNPGFMIMQAARSAVSRQELFQSMISKGIDEKRIEHELSKLLGNKTLRSHTISLNSSYDGVWYISMPRNSPEHDICISIIARHLESRGIRSRVYNNSYGPDIIASINGRRTAIEYETGMKETASTAKMLEYRKRSYSSIVIVANDANISRYEPMASENVKVCKFSQFIGSDAPL